MEYFDVSVVAKKNYESYILKFYLMIDKFNQKKYFNKLDFVIYTVIWLLISLPFSAIKGGIADPSYGYPNIILFNRLLFVSVGFHFFEIDLLSK